MVSSIARSTASGSTADFGVPFPYLDRTHVQVRLNGVLKALGVDYTFTTDSLIHFTAGNPVAGTVVERKRVTPTEPLTDFSPGNLDTGDLNVGILQPLYLAQEGNDSAADILLRAWFTTSFGNGGTITVGPDGTILIWDASGNVVPGPSASDIVGYSEAAEAAKLAAEGARDASQAAQSGATTQASIATTKAAEAAASAASIVVGPGGVQAYDVDLAAIALLTTTAYGRSLLTMAATADVRASLDTALYVADRAAAKALDPTKDSAFMIIGEGGRNGPFIFKLTSTLTAVEAAAKAADTQEGIYFTNGLYTAIRQYVGRPDPYWFGALGGTTNDSAAFQVCLEVTRDCFARYRSDGYTLGGIIMRDGYLLEGESKVTLKCTAQTGGYMFAIQSFGIGEYSYIKNFLLDGSAADAASTAIRFDTGNGIVFGFRSRNTDFRSWGEAVGDVSHATNYVVDVEFEDCTCFFTRGQQVRNRRSRGSFHFKHFKVDHTNNTGVAGGATGVLPVTFDAFNITDVVGLQFDFCNVVGPVPAQGTPAYQSGVAAYRIVGVAGGMASVVFNHCYADNTQGRGFVVDNILNLMMNEIFSYQNLGTQITLTNIEYAQLNILNTKGAVGLTGAAPTAPGIFLSTCNKVTGSHIIADSNTGSGVLLTDMNNCTFDKIQTVSNAQWGWIETGTGNKNVKTGMHSLSNTSGSLTQVGAQSACVSWYPNSGTYTASTLGAVSV